MVVVALPPWAFLAVVVSDLVDLAAEDEDEGCGGLNRLLYSASAL